MKQLLFFVVKCFFVSLTVSFSLALMLTLMHAHTHSHTLELTHTHTHTPYVRLFARVIFSEVYGEG